MQGKAFVPSGAHQTRRHACWRTRAQTGQMSISVFDLFSIGIGPSSSHTVGPMRAARMFAAGLREDGLLSRTRRVHAALFGSLGATGHGHGSDRAVLLGLLGEDPETVDVSTVDTRCAGIRQAGRLALLGEHPVP